jgi:hypothetical protein
MLMKELGDGHAPCCPRIKIILSIGGDYASDIKDNSPSYLRQGSLT